MREVFEGKTGEAMSKLLPMLNHAYENPVTKETTVDELRQNIGKYFEYCMENELRPGVENLSLWLGVCRSAFLQWSKGERRKEFQEVAMQAKQTMAAYMEYMFQKGEINPVSGIFLLKNWYGYKDTVTNEVEVKTSQFGETMTNEEIAGLIEE